MELSGSSAGSNADGFSLTGGTSTIRGLVVNNWGDEGLALTSGGNSVFGNYIGTDVTGSAAAPNKIGGWFSGAPVTRSAAPAPTAISSRATRIRGSW